MYIVEVRGGRLGLLILPRRRKTCFDSFWSLSMLSPRGSENGDAGN